MAGIDGTDARLRRRSVVGVFRRGPLIEPHRTTPFVNNTIADLADPVPADIERAANGVGVPIIDALRGARMLVTGGTGFLGSWLVDVLLALNRRYALGIKLTLLTRQKAALALRRPDWSACPQISVLQGDTRNFSAAGMCFTHVVHAATDVSDVKTTPMELAESIVTGSRHVLDIAAQSGASRYLYFSSGAVVGKVTGPDLITEDMAGAPPVDDHAGYSNAKRYAEHLHLLAAAETGLEIVIARGFTFIGPRMPLQKFAVGNFLRDALRGNSPRLNSVGLSHRSYLYAADAALWLTTLLASGKPGRIYNVGSDQAITVRQLSERVAQLLDSPPPIISATSFEETSFYVPSIHRIQDEFNLDLAVPLNEAIQKTAHWVRNSGYSLT